MNDRLRNLARALHHLGAVKKGEFKLKSGVTSPFYIDLRLIISKPDLLKEIGELFAEKMKNVHADIIVGVPYTALFFATALSLKTDVGMILRRKEKKDYGTQKKIEGIYVPHQTCLVIEDIVTSGMSILETVDDLQEAKLVVKDVFCVIDREAAGRDNLKKRGIELHPLFTLTTFFQAIE